MNGVSKGAKLALVLRRKVGEEIAVGDDVVIGVVEVNNNAVKLAIKAPKSVNILRRELEKKKEREGV